MTRLDKRGRRIGRNWWREYNQQLLRDSADAWQVECEAIALGYATETAEFRLLRPMPTLKQCLTMNAGMTRMS